MANPPVQGPPWTPLNSIPNFSTCQDLAAFVCDYPGIELHEEPGYRTTSGVVPIVGTDPAAREDALAWVPTFLARYPLD